MDPMDPSAHRGHSAENRRPRQRPRRRPWVYRVTQKKRSSKGHIDWATIQIQNFLPARTEHLFSLSTRKGQPASQTTEGLAGCLSFWNPLSTFPLGTATQWSVCLVDGNSKHPTYSDPDRNTILLTAVDASRTKSSGTPAINLWNSHLPRRRER